MAGNNGSQKLKVKYCNRSVAIAASLVIFHLKRYKDKQIHFWKMYVVSPYQTARLRCLLDKR